MAAPINIAARSPLYFNSLSNDSSPTSLSAKNDPYHSELYTDNRHNIYSASENGSHTTRRVSNLQNDPTSYGFSNIPELANNASTLVGGKIFVGGLSWETDEQSLRDYFEQFGRIIDCVIMRDRHTGHPRGFGFVTYEDELIAEAVAANRHELDGRQVEAKRAVPRSECSATARTAGNSKANRKIFVGGLPASCSDETFRGYFGIFGEISESQVMYDHQTGNSRGFGFVTFLQEKSVDRVVDFTSPHTIMGKFVEVKRAEPKQVMDARKKNQLGNGNGSIDNLAGNISGFNGRSISPNSRLMNSHHHQKSRSSDVSPDDHFNRTAFGFDGFSTNHNIGTDDDSLVNLLNKTILSSKPAFVMDHINGRSNNDLRKLDRPVKKGSRLGNNFPSAPGLVNFDYPAELSLVSGGGADSFLKNLRHYETSDESKALYGFGSFGMDPLLDRGVRTIEDSMWNKEPAAKSKPSDWSFGKKGQPRTRMVGVDGVGENSFETSEFSQFVTHENYHQKLSEFLKYGDPWAEGGSDTY